MNHLPESLWMLGSGIILSLGSLHLLYTLFTNKLHPKRELLTQSMKETRPVLTNRTTLWRSWIGFNCSHSIGAIYFGLVNIYLVIAHPDLILSNGLMISLNLTVSVSYCLLARKYWFNIPLNGTLSCLTCYLLSIIIHHIS